MLTRSRIAVVVAGICLAPAAAWAQGDRTGYASVNGLEMYDETHGNGPPLVLLHGALVTITQGADAIMIFEKNPDDLVSFCRRCGSVLFSVVREGRFLHVTMGTLADDPAIRPMFHIFVGSKAPWHEIADALPRYVGFPPPEALGM